jgi:hypothetical protein
MQIYGSRNCVNCHQKYDWTGSLENQVDEKMQNEILRDRNLYFARFLKIEDNIYQVEINCPNCREHNKFEYKTSAFYRNQKDVIDRKTSFFELSSDSTSSAPRSTSPWFDELVRFLPILFLDEAYVYELDA